MPATSTKKTLTLLLGATLLFGLLAATSADEKRLSVYAPVATYTLPVVQRSGHEYVGLLELLEPLGRVSSNSAPPRWKMRFNAIDADFTAGKLRARIHGRDYDLTAPFVIENSRGLVPVASLSSLLPRFLGTAVNFHESARRLFIGEVGLQPNFRLESTPTPRVVLNFNAPVNPTISTEPGRLRMVFKRDPVVSPGSQSIAFDSKVITQATFSESNGEAELEVDASAPLMANFSDGGRTITLVAAVPNTSAGALATAPPTGVTALGAPSAANTAAPQDQAQPQAQQPAQSQNQAAPANTPAPIRRTVVVVDPAHGGEERGAALTATLAEKDVTLGFGRLLRHELETRGFAVLLLRDGDTTVSLDQRAGAANAARAAAYVSLHAVSQGNGSRVYTALLPVAGLSAGNFHAWNSAQASALPASRSVADAVASEIQKYQFAVHQSSASLRPLNNLLMPAVAVELAPGNNGIADLSSANYQQRAAAAIADALNSVRDQLGVQP